MTKYKKKSPPKKKPSISSKSSSKPSDKPSEKIETEPVENISDVKKDKLYHNLYKTAQQHVKGKAYQPSTFKEICSKLGLQKLHEPVLRQVLKQLCSEGGLRFIKQRYHVKKEAIPVVRGVLSVHPRGFAFLQADKSENQPQDIFIPKHLTAHAIHGDVVEVVINQNAPPNDKGPEGKVVAILERARTHVAGIVRTINDKGTWAYVPLLGENKPAYVDDVGLDKPLEVGDRLVMNVVEWGGSDRPTRCTVSHRLGHIDDASCDIVAAIEEHNIRSDFPVAVVAAAQKHGRIVKARDIAEREDLRHLETFTIDPATARDYDDALSLSVDKRGHYHLGVHIADVSHYVTMGSELDLEAYQRCNSTYFPGYCVPMLPHELSNNLCSLCANVNRLTVSVLVELDKEGELLNYRIVRSTIRSQKRFTYEEAKEVLDGKRRSKHAPTLHLMVELCRLLKKQRYRRGSLEFSLPELVIVVDDQGEPTGTRRVEYDITHQLVEEFMLKANELVALHLARQGKTLAYRVHDQPAQDNMREFAQICQSFGFKVPNEPTPADLQALFDEAVETPYGEYLANAYIRRMRLACYSAENIGHFGLSLEHYCHFTSPIRRYVDLVIHRSLFEEIYTDEEFSSIATLCSEKERLSARAEQSVLMLKKLRWLAKLKTSEPQRQYAAIVTRIKPFGLYFEVLDVMLEGFLHVSELDGDYYNYRPQQMQLVGEHTGAAFKVADKITVQLNSVNFITSETRWHLVGEGVHRRPRMNKVKAESAEIRPDKSSSKKRRSQRGKRGRGKHRS
jgi:ribonuclease R